MTIKNNCLILLTIASIGTIIEGSQQPKERAYGLDEEVTAPRTTKRYLTDDERRAHMRASIRAEKKPRKKTDFECLQNAIREDDTKTFNELVEKRPDLVDSPIGLVFSAVSFSSPEIVKILIEHLSPFDINKKNYNDQENTLLMDAINRRRPGIVEIVQLLINKDNQDVNTKDALGNTALHVVTKRYKERITSTWGKSLYENFLPNAETILSLLLAVPNIKVNERNRDRETPLQIAAKTPWGEGVNQLVKHPKIVLTDPSLWKSAQPNVKGIVKRELSETLSSITRLPDDIVQCITWFYQ